MVFGRKNKNPKESKKSTPVKNEKNASIEQTRIAPHFDTQDRTDEPNPNVEISQALIPDSLQTDGRPQNR